MAFAALGDAERACELLALINPVNHSLSPQAMNLYKVEPYVVTADVYAVEPHIGRGGWSWYTGSAGWLYRLVTESILGLRLEGDRLRIAPCVPKSWGAFTITYRYRETTYEIDVEHATSTTTSLRMTVDGAEQSAPTIALTNDGATHAVKLILASPAVS
jgi:cellobiose phosphorylase